VKSTATLSNNANHFTTRNIKMNPKMYHNPERLDNSIQKGCINPRHQVSWVTKFCEGATNVCGSSPWNMLNVSLLAPKILKWLLDFWKLCAPPG